MSKIKAPQLSIDDPLAQAGQTLLRHYARGLQFSEQVLLAQHADAGSDSDNPPGPASLPVSAKQIKKMRVATRRMRGVLRMFEPYFKRKFSKTLNKPLRELALLGGRTRDLQLMIESAQAHVVRSDDDGKQVIQPMIAEWQVQQTDAQAKLEAYIQGNIFRKWQTQLDVMLSAEIPTMARAWEVGEPSRLRHVLEAWLWQHIADVRAYDELPERPSPEQVHALRIAIKHLRYLIEALWLIWPTPQQAWIVRLHKHCVAAQDAYGGLNDVHTQELFINTFIEEARQGGRRIPLKGIRIYAAEQHRLVEEQIIKWRSFLIPIIKTP